MWPPKISKEMGESSICPDLRGSSARDIQQCGLPHSSIWIKNGRGSSTSSRIHDPPRIPTGKMEPTYRQENQTRRFEMRQKGGCLYRHVQVFQVSVEELHLL